MIDLKKIITSIIDKIEIKEGNDKSIYPYKYRLEKFAVVNFKYVDFYLVLEYSTDNIFHYNLYLTNDFGFKREIINGDDFEYLKVNNKATKSYNYIFLQLGREEIFHYYKNPIHFSFFLNRKGNLESNLNFKKIMNIPEETSGYFVELFSNEKEIGNSFMPDSKLDFVIDKKIFLNQHRKNYDAEFLGIFFNFLRNIDVYKLLTTTTRGSRRRDFWSYKTDYCLYYKGIKIVDKYINSLLKESKTEYYDEYNDSIPAQANKTTISFKISYLDTENFINNYNFEDHIIALINESKKNDELRLNLNITDPLIYSKLEKQDVFHEFGHLFGWCMINSLGYNFGKITKIDLNNGNIENNNFDYRIKKSINKKSYCYHDDLKLDIDRIRLNITSDRRKAITYIVYLVCGAIFNIYYFKINPKYDDFIKIFSNTDEELKLGKFEGKAGSDFEKVKLMKDNLSVENNVYADYNFFTLELFYLLDYYSILNALTDHHKKIEHKTENYISSQNKIIDTFVDEYNGTIIENEDVIGSLQNTILSMLQTRQSLILSVRNLIDKYYRN